MITNKPVEKFQDLLCELFQFDCTDLDFGIYRIMNHERDAIEWFITEDLPKTVAGELGCGALEPIFKARMFAPVEA
jgi:adenine-specific DNA-methyltransferase